MAHRFTFILRMASWILAVTLIASSPVAAQSPPTVAAPVADPACPSSPMVLTVPFAATDRSLWGKGAWFTTNEYFQLSKFSCAGVSLSGAVDAQAKTIRSGLDLAARIRKDGNALVDVRVRFFNPYGNKDQRVTVMLEVLDGERLVRRATIHRLDVEEGHTPQHGETSFLFYPDELQAPLTLRLTVWVTRG